MSGAVVTLLIRVSAALSVILGGLLWVDWAVLHGAIPTIVYLAIAGLAIWYGRETNTYIIAGVGTFFLLVKVLQLILKPTLQLDIYAPLTVVLHVGVSIFSLWLIARLVSLRQGRIDALSEMNTELAYANLKQQASEQKMLDSEQFLRTVFDTVTDGIVTINKDGIIKSANGAMPNITGYAVEDLIDMNVEELMPASYRQAHRTGMQRYLAGGESRIIGKGLVQVEVLHRDGTIFPVEVGITQASVKDEGIFVGTFRDISQRKRLETEREEMIKQLEQSNMELDNFVRAASHDLKSPLRAIDKTSEWLAESLSESTNREDLNTLSLMRRRVGRMERLLDDLTSYARIGKSQDDRFRETISGDELMTDILLLAAPTDNFRIEWSDAFREIQISRMPLEQVLLNLITNAIKHHDKGRGRVSVDVQTDGSEWQISVSDDGPGIDPEYHDRIFKMFETLQSRDVVEGSGLGLSIVQKQIESVGGRIWLNSQPGAGSTFYFTWPKA